MKSFKEYAKTAPTGTNGNEAEKMQTASEEKTLDAEELTKKIAAAYNGRSNTDMLRNILTEAEKSKRAGTLSNEEIENFYLAFSPMLDNFQRRKLRSIVDKLKQIEP